jgi:hypothetical protein
MFKSNGPVDRIKIGLLIGLLTAMTGCAGYYGQGYYGEGDDVVASDPDMYLFGGDYGNGRDVHNYSQRGSASRQVAHSGGNHGATHSGGGQGGRR